MKIFLVLLSPISTSPTGGRTVVFFQLANGLASRGYEVFALAPVKEKVGEVPLHQGVHFFDLNENNYSSYFYNNPLNKLRTLFVRDRKRRRVERKILDFNAYKSAIESLQKQYSPDIIISFQQDATYFLQERLKTQIPVITMIHRAPSEYFNKPEFEIYKPSLEKCIAIQVLKLEYVHETNQFLPKSKVVAIPNTVPQYTEQARLESPVIINVGRVSNVKRQHLIVEAFAKLKDSFPTWKVEFWGSHDSDYAKILKRRIEELGLGERITFCGTTNKVADKLSAASIFAFPSQYEGFGLALAEAMSMGLPAIGCRNCPSVNSIIQDGINGLLCEDNPEDLAQKLQQLMDDYELRIRLGTVAKESMQKYAEEVVLDQWEELLNSIHS